LRVSIASTVIERYNLNDAGLADDFDAGGPDGRVMLWSLFLFFTALLDRAERFEVLAHVGRVQSSSEQIACTVYHAPAPPGTLPGVAPSASISLGRRGALAPKLFDDAYNAQSAKDVYCALVVGHTFGFAPEHMDILRRLVDVDWHTAVITFFHTVRLL
jgi:hypothetical protein